MFGSTFTGNDDEPEDYFTWEQRTMTTTPNTAANGGQILTWQERVTPEWLAYWKGRGYNPSEGAMMGEIANLRAFLAAVPASEPVAYAWHLLVTLNGELIRGDLSLKQHSDAQLAELKAHGYDYTITTLADIQAPAPVSASEPVHQLREALQEMLQEKVDYMTRNNLGNPYSETTTQLAVKALADTAAAAPAPVSGMPDLASLPIYERPKRGWQGVWNTASTEKFYFVADVERLLNPTGAAK